jgi:tight adherence protein C
MEAGPIMNIGGSSTLIAFLGASSLVLLVSLLVTGRRARLQTRLGDLAGRDFAPPEPASVARLARSALPKMGKALVPGEDEEQSRLKLRLVRAGLYGQQAMMYFLGVKMVLMVGPAAVGLAAGLVGLITVNNGLLFGACAGMGGIIGPSFWLDAKKSQRQTMFRRSLPDALDVLVICLEGGLSLPAALRRVSDDLQTAHPLLAAELHIVQREIHLGRSPGEALQQMAHRADLEELRSLASVILQADRFGASLVRSMRVHADTLREKRQQRAEEMAQKASVKLLVPTILFIFPVIFVVILGPAMIHLVRIFAGMNLPR